MHVFEFQMTSSLYLHVNRKLGRCCQYFSLLSEVTFAFRLQAVSLFLENTRERTQNSERHVRAASSAGVGRRAKREAAKVSYNNSIL